MKKFKWIIELEVDPSWIGDGFNPTADQFHEAIRESMLGYAEGDEIQVKLLKVPNQNDVAKEQGYESYKDPRFERASRSLRREGNNYE